MLKEWINELGVAGKTVVLKNSSKRIALILSSITCRNINLKCRRNAIIHDNYLGLIRFLEECKCEYEIAGSPCDTDILISREFPMKKICGRPRLVIVGRALGFHDYNRIDFVFFTRTVIPNQYVVEINNIKFLVRTSKCSINPVVLSDEEKKLLRQIRASLEENGYPDRETILLIIESFYNVGRSQARHIMYEMAEKGLLVMSKNYIEIPYFE